MTKAEIKRIVNSCIELRNLCRVFFRYDANYWYYFPLISNDKLFLGAEEDDFIIDGYSIRRYTDIKKVEIKMIFVLKSYKRKELLIVFKPLM